MPRPTKIPAVSFNFFFLEKRIIKAPTTNNTHAKYLGLTNFKIKRLSPTSPKLKIIAVAVLPTLAPNTTGIACPNFIIPAFTNPISISVVAAEL